MLTRLAPLSALCALALSACGGDGSDNPEGTNTATTKQRTIADQVRSVERCTGNVKGGKLAVFSETVRLAEGQGGLSTSLKVEGSGVQLVAYPTTLSAMRGLDDARARLIQLQQQDAEGYRKLAATATDLQTNVVVIAPRGPLPGAANAKLADCIQRSLKA